MSKLTKNILGIEVSKDTLKAVLVCDKQIFVKQFANSSNGFQLIRSMLDFLEIEKVHACLEATDSYSTEIANFLFEQGHTVSIVNHEQLKKYLQSQTQETKAHQLADYCKKENPSEWFPHLLDSEQNSGSIQNWAFSI